MLLPWRRLAITALAVVALLLAGERLPASETTPRPPWATRAVKLLAALPIEPPASMAGYSRERFGSPWDDIDDNGCDTRNDILRLDLRHVRFAADSTCVIARGALNDPYTGRRITFVRGVGTSSAVQIDHVVALADAWRTGASKWTAARRLRYANDPSVLLAVDGPENEAKGDDDASEWLPDNPRFACAYVATQIAIKTEYGLWVTPAEDDAMAATLADCGVHPRALKPRARRPRP
jgi:Protein of unknown function (DUF1524)